MKMIKLPGWRYYLDEVNHDSLDVNKAGKWMFFYRGPEAQKFAEDKCRLAVEQNIVCEAKVSDNPVEGVSCYYLSYDDIAGHKRVIQYFLENNMINRTKTGRLYNISFKLDQQTSAGEYGLDFKATIKLEDFVDLNTGKWLKT